MNVHRITRLLGVGLATGAIAAPAASARPAPLDTPTPARSAEPQAFEPGPAPVAQNVDEGFDWGSAAIGAGGAGALILLVSAGGTSYRHRHEHLGVAR